ncbi:MAG: hypothetical protein JWM68_2841 [Verrucomicrobiales bacterium]|nr:hypothetical protein [Verrucomicrobiales bacterium]
MAAKNSTKPSFSAGNRLLNGFNFCLSIIAAVALLVMANYLASGYPKRFEWTNNSRWQLAPQTTRVLETLTNDINVTVFFDAKAEPEVFGLTTGLLKEYSLRSSHVKVKIIDYARFPGAAEGFLSKYKHLDSLKDKDFVLFENEGRPKVVFANQLSDYDFKRLMAGETNAIPRIAFKGELLFSSALFSVTHARPFKVFFLTGHGEHDPENSSQDPGYGKFASLLTDESNIQWEKISLQSTNELPSDSLLIIAGPIKSQILDSEREKIETFLKQGGRMLAMPNSVLQGGNSGLEKILAKWGVEVANNLIADDDQYTVGPNTLLTAALNPEHAITKPFVAEQRQLLLIAPRSISKALDASKSADAPKIEWLASTSPNAVGQYPSETGISRERKGPFHLMVTVEQGGIKGVNAERGATRIVVIGDSLCFDNQVLDKAANHYFANAVINWLTARPTILLDSLGPRPIKQYELIITPSQMRMVQWILLAAMPGAVLLLGGLVWLRRRS